MIGGSRFVAALQKNGDVITDQGSGHLVHRRSNDSIQLGLNPKQESAPRDGRWDHDSRDNHPTMWVITVFLVQNSLQKWARLRALNTVTCAASTPCFVKIQVGTYQLASLQEQEPGHRRLDGVVCRV